MVHFILIREVIESGISINRNKIIGQKREVIRDKFMCEINNSVLLTVVISQQKYVIYFATKHTRKIILLF